MTEGHNNVLEDYLTRIEAEAETARQAQEAITLILLEMKISGFDIKAVKKMIKARLIDKVKEIDAGELYDSAQGGGQ